MRSYHNDPAIKEKFLERVEAHRKADEITKGVYWQGGKGCAVGCTIEANISAENISLPHSLYPEQLGLPIWLAHLEDIIFEYLPMHEAIHWPRQFLMAIRVGIPEESFAIFRDRFQILLLERQRTITEDPEIISVIDNVISLLQRAIAGDEPNESEWFQAKLNAESVCDLVEIDCVTWSCKMAGEIAARSDRSAVFAFEWSTKDLDFSIESSIVKDWLLGELEKL